MDCVDIKLPYNDSNSNNSCFQKSERRTPFSLLLIFRLHFPIINPFIVIRTFLKTKVLLTKY